MPLESNNAFPVGELSDNTHTHTKAFENHSKHVYFNFTKQPGEHKVMKQLQHCYSFQNHKESNHTIFMKVTSLFLKLELLLLLVGCLMFHQHASVSHEWICSDNFTCYHTETEVADQTFHLTQIVY